METISKGAKMELDCKYGEQQYFPGLSVSKDFKKWLEQLEGYYRSINLELEASYQAVQKAARKLTR